MSTLYEHNGATSFWLSHKLWTNKKKAEQAQRQPSLQHGRKSNYIYGREKKTSRDAHRLASRNILRQINKKDYKPDRTKRQSFISQQCTYKQLKVGMFCQYVKAGEVRETNDQPYSLLSALLLQHFQEHIICLHRAPASSSNSIMVLQHQQSPYILSIWTETPQK